jgi:tripartite-type tricarboxylate transporter receptor subunit TctC
MPRGTTLKAYSAWLRSLSAPERLRALPHVPAAKEVGLKYDLDIWAGIFAPKGVSKEVIGKLGAALDKALDDPVVVKRLADLGASIPTKKERNPTSFDRLVKAEIVRWSPILKAASATQNGVGGCPSRRGRLYADIDLTPAAARVIGVSGLALG